MADVAARLGVNGSKVGLWIQTGELKAVNVATDPRGKRARWRITPEALSAFEAARAAVPTTAKIPKPSRERRANSEEIEYF
ncbi:MAG: DNA-binding protein [Thermoguttaceae bacterium]